MAKKKRITVLKRMLFAWFMLAGFAFLFAPRNLTNKFQFAFVRIFRWPLNIGRDVSLSASRLVASVQGSPSDVVSRRKYDKLHNHLANVTEWLDQERKKVEKLSGLQDRPVWKGVNFVLAGVITTSIDKSRSELIINRGQEDGLAGDQFVLVDNSIVGTISDVASRTARVKLITDPASAIGVKIAQFKMDRIMQGTGDDSASVRLVSTKYKIRTGDVVYAQKKPGFLSTPVITGTVSQCRINDENPLLWDITVKPACDIEKLSDVVVIVMNPAPSDSLSDPDRASQRGPVKPEK